MSDNNAIPELLKIGEIFYNAKNTIINSNDIDFINELDISSKSKELKELKDLCNSIIETRMSVRYYMISYLI
jgi:hypothetical protein